MSTDYSHDGGPGTKSLIILMGPSGAGKSTVGGRLGSSFHVPFIEGDDYLSAENRLMIQNGELLTDRDHDTWRRAIRNAAMDEILCNKLVFVAYSALTRSDRDLFRRAVWSINRNTEQLGYEVRLLFVYLHLPQSIAEPLVDDRARRNGHHMPVELVPNQYDILESPEGEEDCRLLDARPQSAQLFADASALIRQWLRHS